MTDRSKTPITVRKKTPAADAEERKTLVESTEFSPNAFTAMIAKMSGSGAEGTEPKSFRFRELTLTIPMEALRPGTYDAPIKLTLRELSSEGEMRAYRATGAHSEEGGIGAVNQPETGEAGSGIMLAQAIAREAIHAVNGYVLRDNYEKDMAWNSMTLQGRMAVAETFFVDNTDGETAKKISESIVVS